MVSSVHPLPSNVWTPRHGRLLHRVPESNSGEFMSGEPTSWTAYNNNNNNNNNNINSRHRETWLTEPHSRMAMHPLPIKTPDFFFYKVILFNPLSTGQSKIGRRRPIKLDNHCVFISQRISTNKISLERSFPYLNVDTLFLKIGQVMTPLQLFEVT